MFGKSFPNNLKMKHVLVLERNGIKEIDQFKFLKADFESMTFEYIRNGKNVTLRR